jgi:deoxyribonuclease V
MNVPHLHDWPTTEPEAVELQNALMGQVRTSARFDTFELVAGCDAAYHLTDPILYAAVVVVRSSDRAVVP